MRQSRAACSGMDECVDSSCKRRAEYLCHSLVIVHTERGQWQVSFLREKSTYLAEVSGGDFTEIPNSPRNPGETDHARSVYRALFCAHARKPGNAATLHGTILIRRWVTVGFGGDGAYPPLMVGRSLEPRFFTMPKIL